MNKIDLMENYENYYGEYDKEIMLKLEKKLNDTQTQINNDSDLTKANELYQETIDYLKRYETRYWERLSEPAFTCGKADSEINQLAWTVLYQELEDFEKTFKFTGSGVPEHLQSVKHSLQPFESERQKRKYIRNMKNHREAS